MRGARASIPRPRYFVTRDRSLATFPTVRSLSTNSGRNTCVIIRVACFNYSDRSGFVGALRLGSYGGVGTDCSLPLMEANTRFAHHHFAGAVQLELCLLLVSTARHP